MNTQSIISLFSILLSIITIFLSFFYNKRVLSQKSSEDEKKEIYKKLNEFFGPFLAVLEKNKMLYNIFVEHHKKGNSNFRTLFYLLENPTLSGNEKVLIDEIIKNNDLLEKLLIEKAGLVDSQALRDNYFPKFLTHCNIIKLAYNGQLVGEPERFKDYIYPKGIDELLKIEFDKYKQRLIKLNENSFPF